MFYIRYNTKFLVHFPFDLQMLTSKDTNFIGYTFKKSDVLKSLENSGRPLLLFNSFLETIFISCSSLGNHISRQT